MSKEPLPTWLVLHACTTGDCGCEKQRDCERKVFHDIINEIKAVRTPNEPGVKAQGFDEWELTELTIDDDTTRELCRIAYQAGQRSQVRLPEKDPYQIAFGDVDGDLQEAYADGYNAAIDDMRKLNGLENGDEGA